MKKLLLLLFALAVSVTAQVSAPQIQYVTTNPTGNACGATNIALRTPNGLLYTCQSGTYALAFSGSGTGCTTAGAAGEILVDDGAGGCTSTAPTISSTTITASLTGHASLDLPLTGGTLTGNLLFSTDNTRDIGASGATRPRDFFLGRNALIGGTLGVTGAITGSLTGNASTATALAANPTDCSANQFANAIAASGNLTCAAPLTLTTTGSSGAATFIAGTLNIPQYSGGGGSGCTTSGSAGQILTDDGTGGCTSNSTAAGILTFLATPSSANLASALTDETGSSLAVFNISPLLVTPHVTTILDGNGNPFLVSTAATSAVDSITITNAATTSSPVVAIGASGSDSNINLQLLSKANGAIKLTAPTIGAGPVSFTALSTFHVQDATPSTGITNLLVGYGAGQGSNSQFTLLCSNNSTPCLIFTEESLHVRNAITDEVTGGNNWEITQAGFPGRFITAGDYEFRSGGSGASIDTNLSPVSAGVIGAGTGSYGSHAGTFQSATIIIDNSSFTFNGHTCTIVSTVVTCP